MSAAAAGWLQVGLLIAALAAAHRLLGDWMARAFTTPGHWRVERLAHRAVGVDADSEQRGGLGTTTFTSGAPRRPGPRPRVAGRGRHGC